MTCVRPGNHKNQTVGRSLTERHVLWHTNHACISTYEKQWRILVYPARQALHGDVDVRDPFSYGEPHSVLLVQP